MEKQLEEAKFIAEDTDRKYDEVILPTRFDVAQWAQELGADFEAGCLVNLLIISQGLLWRVALLDWLLYDLVFHSYSAGLEPEVECSRGIDLPSDV